MMNIFEFAMKMEEDGRAYYLEHAEKTNLPGLKRILTELAEDELKHFNIFKAMRDAEKVEYEEAEGTTILSTLKNVFQSLKAENKSHTFKGDVKKIWEQALEVEEKSENFYREKVRDVDDENRKRILNKIADEEHKHYVAIENVIRFLDRPREWLEDAEWSNLEDY